MTTFNGNGLVWDKERKKPLCKFIKGEYKTDDPREIKLLKEIDTVQMVGQETETPEENKQAESTLTKPDIMALLDEAEIKYNPRDKKEVLLKLLEGE